MRAVSFVDSDCKIGGFLILSSQMVTLALQDSSVSSVYWWPFVLELSPLLLPVLEAFLPASW